jgi:alpha-galactosidase
MSTISQMTKQLAATPPMGWNSWNAFGARITEIGVRETADAFVTTGLKDCGYEYLVIDDCWSVRDGRDNNGDLVADPEKVPNGMKALADYVHGRGLKIGIYSCASHLTCARYPGSHGFEEQDARLWAGWGIDFLKYDYCHAPAEQDCAIERYARMGEALRKSGRDFVYSLCEWGARSPHLWGKSVGGHMWRVTGDVVDSWASVWVASANWLALGIDNAVDAAVNLHEYAGPGAWNDLDMLVVGLRGGGQIPGSGASFVEYQTQMSMWAMLCSPLMIGCDVRSMGKETAEILMNREVLAINQDPLGKQAVRIKQTGPLEVWKKPLADGSLALALLNRGSSRAEISFSAGEIGLLDSHKGLIRDVWKQEPVCDFKKDYSQMVVAHGTCLLRIANE